MGILHTAATRAVEIIDEIHVKEEKAYLRQALQNNGYTLTNIDKSLRKAEKKYDKKRILPYIRDIVDRMSSITNRYLLKTVFKTIRVIRCFDGFTFQWIN